MKRVFSCLITVSVLFLHSQAKTNQTFLTTADYRRMLEALENSPDVAIPKPPDLCVMGERPTYLFLCSVCGKETRYWREEFVDCGHIKYLRKLVEEIRGMRCDARLDDTWLCQYCHPERFAFERRPVAAVLRKGLQKIPNHSGWERYVPKDLELSVKDVDHGGAIYWLETRRPYTVVERSALDSENRLTREVYATSFIPVRVGDPWKSDRLCDIRLAATQGVGGVRLDDVHRALPKGTKVSVEDIPPPIGDGLTGTTDWSKYCLVTTPDCEMSGYWGCSVKITDVSNVRYEDGVNGSFYPVFLSVNGGAKLLVGERELNVLMAFLTGNPIATYNFDYCCATKSNADWLRRLLVSGKNTESLNAHESSKSYVSEARQRLENAASRCPEFRDAIMNGCLQRMEWNLVSNLVAKTEVVMGLDRRMRLRTFRSIEAMQQAEALIRRHCDGFYFNSGFYGGGCVLMAHTNGLLLKFGYEPDERIVPWTDLFSKERNFARKLFDQCIQREWPDVRAEDRPALPQLGFVLLLKYVVPEVPSPLESYMNDVFQIRERMKPSHSLDEDIKLMFPDIPIPGNDIVTEI